MRRTVTLAAVAGLIVGLFGFWNPSNAAEVASCSQSSYTIWENVSYNGDGLHVCYPVNLPDLFNVTHVQSGLCNAPVNVNDSWDNCINSAINYGGGSERHDICFFTARNYGGNGYRLHPGYGVQWSTGNLFSDTISSIGWC